MASAKPAGDDRDPGSFAPKSYLFRDYLPSRYSGKGSFEVRSSLALDFAPYNGFGAAELNLHRSLWPPGFPVLRRAGRDR